MIAVSVIAGELCLDLPQINGANDPCDSKYDPSSIPECPQHSREHYRQATGIKNLKPVSLQI
jgi:hypothetical protein